MATDRVKEFDRIIRDGGFIWGPFPQPYGGGVSGMHMLGPMGANLFNDICSMLRRLYGAAGFSEVMCPSITPYEVWEASGHVGGFYDPLIRCTGCYEEYRGDKLLSELFPEILTDDLPLEDLGRMLKEVDLKCPSCGTRLDTIRPYSVMFETTIGARTKALLRPETATTTYLSFPELARTLAPPWPIKVFQIGKAFRNEINPRRSLVRMREFHQAEFQVVVPPLEEFTQLPIQETPLADEPIPISTVEDQKGDVEVPTSYTATELIQERMVDRPILAWCMATSSKAVRHLGFTQFRLRQHMYPRMRFRHPPSGPPVYNVFAWDIEHRTSKYGWVEMAGVHDRADYDCRMQDEFSQGSFRYRPPRGDALFPLVYEMAFGLERLVICMIDNALRLEPERTWLDFPVECAPIKASVLPFSEDPHLLAMSQKVYQGLWKSGIRSRIDIRKSLGARFRQSDELGVPYCLSLDSKELEKGHLRLRDIRSRTQRTVNRDAAVEAIDDLLNHRTDFHDLPLNSGE